MIKTFKILLKILYVLMEKNVLKMTISDDLQTMVICKYFSILEMLPGCLRLNIFIVQAIP